MTNIVKISISITIWSEPLQWWALPYCLGPWHVGRGFKFIVFILYSRLLYQDQKDQFVLQLTYIEKVQSHAFLKSIETLCLTELEPGLPIPLFSHLYISRMLLSENYIKNIGTISEYKSIFILLVPIFFGKLICCINIRLSYLFKFSVIRKVS